MQPNSHPKFTIVDDDSHVLFFAERALREAFPKSDIVTFDDGAEALEYLRTGETDILITDHSMVCMNGSELIRQLREDGYSRPIIMISNSPHAREEGTAAGATVFLEKDRAMTGLLGIVEDLLKVDSVSGKDLPQNT